MSQPLRLRPEAQADIREARDWYEERRPGLGREFLATVRETLAAVERSPLLHPRLRGEIRRARLPRFPYSFLFIVEPGQTIVFACFHARRDPKSWQSRLDDKPR